MTSTATVDPTRTPICPPWCSTHLDDGEGGTVHQALVSVGAETVTLEVGPEGGSTAILLPVAIECDARSARDLAEALRLAAWIVEGHEDAHLLVDRP